MNTPTLNSPAAKPNTPGVADAYDSSKALSADEQTSLLNAFATVMELGGRAGLSLVPGGNAVALTADALASGSASGTAAAAMSKDNKDFDRLLSLQSKMQLQSVEWSTKSNVSKTQHEGVMNAVRNVKA